MAQIKKFTQGGPAVIQDPEKSYGKIFKNGTPYDVHEDTLRWLEGHGSVGIEMARELREGIDQHVDIGSDGVGMIRNISTGTSGMNYRQRRRIGRKQVFGGFFEDPTTKATREIVQGLSEQDYSKFKDNRDVYDFPDITIFLETSLDEQKNPLYTIVPTNAANLDAIARLDEIIKTKKIAVPEGKKAKDYDEINKLNQYIHDNYDKIVEIRKTIRNNKGQKLTPNDIQLLRALGIIYEPSDKVGDTTVGKVQEEHTLNEARKSFISGFNLKENNPIINNFTIKVVGDNGYEVSAGDAITKELTNNHIFSKYDDPKYHPFIGYALIDKVLTPVSEINNSHFDTDGFKALIKAYDFSKAQKLIHFNLPKGVSNQKADWKLLPQGTTIDGLSSKIPYFNLHGQYISMRLDDGKWIPEFSTHVPNKATGKIDETETPRVNEQSPADEGKKPEYSVWNETTIGGKKGYLKNFKSNVRRGGKNVEYYGSLFFVPSENRIYGVHGEEDNPYLSSNGFELDTNNTSDPIALRNKVFSEFDRLQKYVENKKLPRNIKTYSNWLLQLISAGSYYSEGGVLDETEGLRGKSFNTDDKYKKESKAGMESPVVEELLDWKNLSWQDKAEVYSIIADIAGYGTTTLGRSNKNARAVGLTLGIISDILYALSGTRDGIDHNDAINFTSQVGTTFGTHRWSSRGVRILSGLLNTVGLAHAVPAIINIAEVLSDPSNSWKDVSTDDLNRVWNGFKSLTNIGRNAYDIHTVRKLADVKTKADVDNPSRPKDFLSRFNKKDQTTIKIRTVKDVISGENFDKTKIQNQDWLGKNGKVKSYDDAYVWLKKEGYITDDILYKNSDGISESYKIDIQNTLSRAKNFGKNVARIIIGHNPENYVLRGDLDPKSSELIRARRFFTDYTSQETIKDYYNEGFHKNSFGFWVKNDPESESIIVATDRNKTNTENTSETTKQNTESQLPKSEETQVPQRPKEPEKPKDVQPTTNLTPTQLVDRLYKTILDGAREKKSLFGSKTQLTFPTQLDAQTVDAIKSTSGKLLNSKSAQYINLQRLSGRDPRTGQDIYELAQYIAIRDPKSISRTWAIYDNDGKLIKSVNNSTSSLNEQDYIKFSKPKNIESNRLNMSEEEKQRRRINGEKLKNGGKILKAYFGNRIGRLFDNIRSANKDWTDKEVYQHIYDNADLFKIRKKKADFLNAVLSTKDAWDKKDKLNSNFFGRTDPEQKNIFGMVAPVVEYGISAIGNQKVKDKEIEAIRTRSIGEMQSMPIKKPHISTNLNPLYKQYNNQKTELWKHTMDVNNTLSDSRAKLANMNNTMSKLNAGEQDLSEQVSKQLTSDNTQNANLDWAYDAETRRIADANNKVSANTAASIIEKESDYIGTKYDNVTKFMAELRDNENKFNAARRNKDLYAEIQRLQAEYRDMTDEQKKGNDGIAVLNKIKALTKLMDSATAYSRLTGKYSI